MEFLLTALRGGRGRSSVLPALGLVCAVGAWLWPIGVGGRMPVGGDVTQFSIGLMAFLGESLRAGRLPLWNDLWGYGFPGLAESQMGVFYPVHSVLYGMLGLESAYTASLVVHTFWGSLGAYWAARVFGVGGGGAALAGFVWTASGFFVIHLPHQWGYTVGSWMPWAWGLTWNVLNGRRTTRSALLLAAVLVLQVLPGHFQLAFETQAGVCVLVVSGVFFGKLDRRRGLVALAAVVAVAPLAAAQLWPTYRLAEIASARRDFEYLSAFAASPVHLISYVAPGLFRSSPLWRPLAWDAFHTSPEEHLAYVGVVPLFLAIRVVIGQLRTDPAVQGLAIVALVTVVLSLGPYVPGFEYWCTLPGFSFFRASARWSLATGLALAVLAGKGWDASGTWARPGRDLIGYVAVACAATLMMVGLVELALVSTDRPGWPAVERVYERAFAQLPWSNRPEARRGEGESDQPASFHDLMILARRPQQDSRIPVALARQGRTVRSHEDLVFSKQRRSIFARELTESAARWGAVLMLVPFARRRCVLAGAFLVVSVVDLWALGRDRPVDTAPIRPLTAQSSVLGHLASQPRGTRTADHLRNMPMVAGASPVWAYRTLDLLAVPGLTSLAGAELGSQDADAAIVSALRATGAAVRILDPFETVRTAERSRLLPGWETRTTLVDPALASWLHGEAWVKRQPESAARFTVWSPNRHPNIAWQMRVDSEYEKQLASGEAAGPRAVLSALADARGLESRRLRPEVLEVAVEKANLSDAIIVSQLADPHWQASWVDAQGGVQPATIVPIFRRARELGWQSIRVPGPGSWTLRLEYSGDDVVRGLAVSLASWFLWTFLFVRTFRRSTADQGGA